MTTVAAPLVVFIRRGELTVVLGGGLFLWFAITGIRPYSRLFGEDPPAKAMGLTERVIWAALGVALLAFEYGRFKAALAPQ